MTVHRFQIFMVHLHT